jgi:PilZ domain
MQATVFVEVVARMGNSEASLLECEVVDASYGGLRVCVESELMVGTILPLRVELQGMKENLYLTGEVRWCRAKEDGRIGYLAGFELLNSTDTDIKLWRSLLEQV